MVGSVAQRDASRVDAPRHGAGGRREDEDALDEGPYLDTEEDEDADEDEGEDDAGDREPELQAAAGAASQVEVVDTQRAQEDAEEPRGDLDLWATA